MTCRICDWCQKWLGFRAEFDCDQLWAMVEQWEYAYCDDWWPEESDGNREMIDRATSIRDADPEAAFQIYLQAAEAGSPWAMGMVAWHYQCGTVVEPDHNQALDYYHRAICAGSWMATILYVRLLAKYGFFDVCEQVLQDGVDRGFLPAYFWLAKIRFNQSGSRKTCREIRPLLEHASERGHPGAGRFLAGLQLRGKYGLRQMPTGYRMARKYMEEDIQQARRVETSVSDTVDGDRGYASVDAAEPGLARRAVAGSSAASL